MKLFVSLCLLFSFFGSFPDLAEVRVNYIKSQDDKEIAAKMLESLSDVKKSDEKIFVAYKGASLVIMAKYLKERKDKKASFKEGADFIEYAVLMAPKNIEIRVIRLSIQENTPKILNYKTNILEDKEFVLDNYKITKSKEVQAFVKSFALQSEAFTASEKEHFN